MEDSVLILSLLCVGLMMLYMKKTADYEHLDRISVRRGGPAGGPLWRPLKVRLSSSQTDMWFLSRLCLCELFMIEDIVTVEGIWWAGPDDCGITRVTSFCFQCVLCCLCSMVDVSYCVNSLRLMILLLWRVPDELALMTVVMKRERLSGSY